MAYKDLFGVILFYSDYFQVSLNSKVILLAAKITQNTMTELF